MTSTPSSSPRPPQDSAYVAALWEHPTLCVAIFGVQLITGEGQRLYDDAGISNEMAASLQSAPGHLCTVPCQTMTVRLLLQYWESAEALHAWARVAPHTRWWKWLVEHRGKGIGFHHEIYTVSGAEAIYEMGTQPIGPATFCSLEAVRSGEGRSRERLKRFGQAAADSQKPQG